MMPTLEGSILRPDWPAGARIRALVTTRHGGVSVGPYASLNLGIAVADRPEAVAENRSRLRALLPAEPRWLRQVHGNEVVEADGVEAPVAADASVTRTPDVVCAIQMADCLPVLLAAGNEVVAAAHAGWRGLAAGVIENAVGRMNVAPETIVAWLGPAIGPAAFEVGEDVLRAFVAQDPGAAVAFRPHPERRDKWFADIFTLATRRLHAVGVTAIHGGGTCTSSDDGRFFSHRRDGVSGRMAALVWIDGMGSRA